MGDPRKRRKKYSTPRHPWQKDRIDEEAEIRKKHGVGNKKEIWKMDSKLKSYSKQAKGIIKMGEKGAEEAQKLIQKLVKLSLLTPNSTIDDILSLKLQDIMERRLQTIVFRKKLAKSIKQARQFIVHRHIAINGKVITSPSYIVSKDEEEKVKFLKKSPLANPEHPERKESKKEMIEKEMIKKQEIKEKEIKKEETKTKKEKPEKSKEKEKTKNKEETKKETKEKEKEKTKEGKSENKKE